MLCICVLDDPSKKCRYDAPCLQDSGGPSFEDTGSELDIFDFGLGKGNGASVELVASIKTASRFASVAWTAYSGDRDQYPMGLIAGGMVDGVVHIWDPAKIMEKNAEGQDANTGRILTLPTQSDGAIKALAFNPLEPFNLAVGGPNGTSWIVDLSSSNPQLKEPCPGHSQKAEITSIAWNSQVSHIVATSAADGSVAVWDLNAKKAWCELRAEAGVAVSDLVWNPKQGLHLLTASADDRNPVIKVWDLAASTSMPVQQMAGHQGGILQLSWCPHDDTLLLSTAKDTRTFLWDLSTMQAIAELPNEAEAEDASSVAAQQNASALFAQATSYGQKHMRHQVTWSPHKRGVALTCSLNRKVQAHSILSLATRSGRPPAWMKPASTAISTSFGGSFLTCIKGERTVKVATIPEQKAFVGLSNKMEKDLESLSIGDFCRLQQEQHRLAQSYSEARTWGFLRVLFEGNARQALLEHLGFKSDEDISLKSVSSEGGESKVDEITNGVSLTGISSPSKMSSKAQGKIERAMVVGNFEAAVEICFQSGNLADALLLASCGGADLWAKTQQRYFEMCSDRPYLAIVKAVMRNQLGDLITERPQTSWQETLAILSTYGASEEFPKLCISLGQRLEAGGDAASASLCYMCALSLDDTVKYWKDKLEQATNKSKGTENSDMLSLHQFVIKVHVMLKAIASSESTANELSDDVAQLFLKYATILAEQGSFTSAAKYIKGTSMEAKVLRDRLYRSRFSQGCLVAMGGVAPEFPYSMASVGTSRGQVYAQQQREAAKQAEMQRLQQEQQRQEAAKAYEQQKLAYEQQQQQQQQAHGHHQQQIQSTSQASVVSRGSTNAAAATKVDALLPGWVALQDPSSGRTYYANQSTGESSWEKPVAPAPAPQPSAPQPTATPVAQQSYEQPMTNASTHSTTTPKKQTLASKYGDGFVTSASDPKLAYQYGNVGTGNPYGGAERPGTAASAVGASGFEQAPVSSTMNVDEMTLSDDVAAIRDSLMSVAEAIRVAQLTGGDKRQLAEAEKGIAVVVKKLARGAIDADMKAQVSSLSTALVNRDFATASHTQTSLVNSAWKEQKDWLKGIKLLIQLASKKLPQAVPAGYQQNGY